MLCGKLADRDYIELRDIKKPGAFSRRRLARLYVNPGRVGWEESPKRGFRKKRHLYQTGRSARLDLSALTSRHRV